MDLKYLTTVKTILEAGSFQKAALKLGYTQSTITFQVQQAEQELGIPLFEKIGRRMTLTQAGKDVLPHIEAILQSMERLHGYGKTLAEMEGTLKIAMPETLLAYKMQPVLRAFKKEAPNVNLLLRAHNCPVIRERVLSGESDIGIYYELKGDEPSVVEEPLTCFRLVLIASPELEGADADFMEENQRKPFSLICSDTSSVFHDIFDRYLRSKNITMSNIMELWSIEAIKRSVAGNLGVAFVPAYAVEEDLKSGIIRELRTAIPNNCIMTIYARHRNKWISPAMELFMRLTQAQLNVREAAAI